MHFILTLSSAPRLLAKSTAGFQPLAYSTLVKFSSPLGADEIKKCPPQVTFALPTSCHRRFHISSRALQNTGFVVSRANSAMLSSYFVRFMSTVQQMVTGAGAKRMEDDHIETLLADPKANKLVEVNACGQLYVELTKTRPILYSGAPHEGIKFEVQYYDSLALLQDEEKKGTAKRYPTVCLLHGAPGHYKDFADMIYYLTQEGIRVIAPNFPDYSATLRHKFRHSPRERLDFLLQFFKAINVNQVELMAGHSSAVYTMFELLNDAKLASDDHDKVQVKSLGLLSTPSHVLPHNLAPTPFRLFTLKLFDYPILRPFILAVITTFAKVQGIRNRVDKNKIEDLLIAASAMGYSQHPKLADRLRLLDKFRIPTILIYGTNDKLITVNNFKQLENDLGITSEEQVKCYKSDGSVERPASRPHELVDVSRFDSGGHYTFQKYSRQVSEDIYNFMLKRGLLADESERMGGKEVDKEPTGIHDGQEVTKL